MRPARWDVPEMPSPREQRVAKVLKKRSFFAFLRAQRHLLFDAAFQTELAAMYTVERGSPPTPPAFLAMVTLLQAYTGVSDADAVEEARTDLKWQLVLGLLDAPELEVAPFAQGTLVGFRRRLMQHDMDRRLLERTVELARASGDFGDKNLRLALDASPLFTTSRVEDTFNLLGHAARNVLAAAAGALGRPRGEVVTLAVNAGIPLLAADPGVSGGSLKARLDVAWERPEERARALSRLVGEVDALGQWLAARDLLGVEPVGAAWAVVEHLLGQDLEPDPAGDIRMKRGVAPDRRPSVEDGEARHGRKSASQKFVGYKGHLALDLDSRLVLAVALAPANQPEARATPAVTADLARVLGVEDAPGALASLSVDRAYLGSELVQAVRAVGGTVLCRPLTPASVGGRYSKAAFTFVFPSAVGAPVGTVTCPAGVSLPAHPGQVARFPTSRCGVCPRRTACTAARGGRSVSVHADEPFYQQLRTRQATPEGRAELRQRTRVEHALARQVRVQGRKARYQGLRKNLFAARVSAVVVNLFTLHHADRERKAGSPRGLPA